ncbi:PREDICTED: zinc finger BED domain-containing protein 4-like [Vollenhovia emeryi]|uniref:zinc finger BED domain-containing protein 4-like n=1 Tax=Vollenhovia emeryi TaxID=411798 RepID=UPI0005F3A9FB|nr:PREDICTED: zinc finger BED domain-containing protein 4-like [Vollenhovia emeryi]
MPKKNPIWDYFVKSDLNLSKAQCNICDKLLSLGSDKPKNQTVHGLKQHLSKFHSEQYKHYLQRYKEEQEQSEPRINREKVQSTLTNNVQITIPNLIKHGAGTSFWPDDHEISRRIDKAIMDFLIVDMLPYSIVESNAFKQINFADPAKPSKYRIKSKKYFRTTLMPATYDKVKAKINDMICQVQWISFTTDIWSNPTKSCSLLSFTAHFILGPQRLKVVLGASVLEEDHTGIYISQKLIELIDSYNIRKKIHMAIRDNAANMNCATRIAEFSALGCVAHTLQLVIQDAVFLQENVEILKRKCRKIVGHFKRSEQATRYLSKCQETCAVPHHSLIQDIETRWNSTFLMLERLNEQKNAINLYSIERGGIETLNNAEWELATNIIKVLKSFYEATLDISRDDACVSLIIPLITMLTGKLQPTDDDDDDTILKMKQKLLESLNKRFAYIKNSTLLITATLLDPRFKTKYLTPDEIEIGKKEVTDFLLKEENTSTSQVMDKTTYAHVENSSATSKNVSEQSLWEAHDNSPKENASEGEISLQETFQSFLKEPRLERNANIYAYWHSSPYQQLQKASKKFLSAPPTSVASEQVFSSAGQIYADRHSNLLGENAEKLLFLCYNIKLFNFDY